LIAISELFNDDSEEEISEQLTFEWGDGEEPEVEETSA